MRILTENNTTFAMNSIPDEVEDMNYCVLDYSDQNNVDYMFIPFLYLESFNEPAVDLRIGKMQMQMPMSWSLIIGDKNSGDLELISLKQINDREFNAFAMNPLSGYMPQFPDIEIINVFPDVKWHFPKLKHGHILAVPLEMGEKPLCAYFVKDTNKLPDVLDITKVV